MLKRWSSCPCCCTTFVFFRCLGDILRWFPYFVNREENKSIPFIGKCIEFNQAIFVSREDPNSRHKTVEEITRRTQSKDPWSQFVIFPEGATSNRKAVLHFKPGGFIPGVPVQPVLMKYPNHHDTISWTWDQPHGVALCILYTVCQLHVYAEIEFLPPYTPSEEEKKDPQLLVFLCATCLLSRSRQNIRRRKKSNKIVIVKFCKRQI